MTQDNKMIAVIVLGDLDRSPRMLNHALSAAQNGYNVTLIGYQGSSLPASILNFQERRNSQLLQDSDQRMGTIQVSVMSTRIVDTLRHLPKFLYLIYAIMRILTQTCQLFYQLLLRKRFDFLLVQNPPCIPLLMVCSLVKFITWLLSWCCCGSRRRHWHSNQGSKIVIDWHNYGWTILEVNRVNNILVKFARFYELFFGRFGDHNLTVSEAMKVNLAEIAPAVGRKPISVLYDRATPKFKPSTVQVKHKLYQAISLEGQVIEADSGTLSLANDRAALLMSSTSYTPDEDFMTMVKALDIVDKDHTLPNIQVIVTGKGPEKAMYDQIFRERNSIWKKTNIRQAWLEIDDYPKMVGSADLGICLHYSSSGYDLPMKVVDMYAAGLPCLAIGGYPSVKELVLDGSQAGKKSQYGLIFLTSEQLAQQIATVLQGFDGTNQDGPTQILRNMRKDLKDFVKTENSWEAQWETILHRRVFSRSYLNNRQKRD